MREFNLHQFSALLHELTTYIWLADRHGEDEEIDVGVAAEMQFLTERLAVVTNRHELKASHNRATRELRWAFKAYGKPTWGRAKAEFKVFWEILEPELAEKRFASIEARKDEYLGSLLGDPPSVGTKAWKGPAPVWAYIWKRFPATQRDFEDAVYAYALELDTPCVFHSMRAAEIGLRALARRMKVKLPKKKRLEWAQWQEILKEMRNEADRIHATAKMGPAKDELLEFYNGTIGQFYGFKDEFRNQVMHVRRTYDHFESGRALTRVRDFMEKLARKIDQNGRRAKA